MRAVVDDPDLLELNGGRPERLAMLSWALGAFLAALAGDPHHADPGRRA